jgi:hypothetical protein
MIIKEQTNAIEQIGTISDESQFKIKVSPKAFQILSSLYSDKPLAIVRELGCNAMDSHIASGQPNRPIHIHVPNSLEPWLTIQDFGTGISHENIYKIYTEYFNSTKTNTNDQVGMLGLGSKAPFCYTDAFTITSIYEGVKRIYNAYFNQQGVPTISLASQENTSDHNGVAIQIPVKQSDLGSFNFSVTKAFRFFDVKPTITGGEINWDERVDFKGSFWKSITSLNQSYAVMGGVAYPIDTYQLSNENYEIARKAGLVINFDIGELDVTPSRESLMYHDWVLENLNNKIELVKKDFLSIVEDTIINSENLLDAMKALYLLQDKWSFLNSSMVKGKVMWRNIEITETHYSLKKHIDSLVSYSKRVWGRSKHSESSVAALHDNSEWFFSNLKAGNERRVINYVRSHQNEKIAVNLVSEDDMKKLIKLGFPASIFVPTSTLPSPTINRKVYSGTRTSKPKGIINVYDFGYSYREKWETKEFNLSTDTAPKYFIVKDTSGWKFNLGLLVGGNDNVIINRTIDDKDEFQNLVDYLGISMNEIRMVSKNNAKHLEELGSENFVDFIKPKLNIQLDWEKIELARKIDIGSCEKIKKHKLFSELDDQNPVKVFVESVQDSIKEIQKLKGLKKYVINNSENSDKNKLTFSNPLVELIYLACDTWQVGIDVSMKAAIELNQNK